MVPQTVNISHTAECKTNTPPSFLYHAASFISCLVRPLDKQPRQVDWARCCLGSIPGKPGWGFYGKLQISTPLGSPDPTPALLVKTIGQRGRSDPESKAAQSSARTQRLLKEGPSARAGHCLATPAAQTPSHPPPRASSRGSGVVWGPLRPPVLCPLLHGGARTCTLLAPERSVSSHSPPLPAPISNPGLLAKSFASV